MSAGEAIFVQAIECSDTLLYSGSSVLTIFNSHLNLQKIPDNIDLSECSNCSRMFSNCYVLSSVPKRLNM